MACKYYYRGHLFNSEIELDNFLLTREQYYNEYGDIVFSSEDIATLIKEKLKLLDLKRKNRKLWNEYIQLSKQGAWLTDEDGDKYLSDLFANKWRYTGVSEFLRGHKKTNEHNKYLFPYFIKKEFFERRFIDWAQGVYNDKEIDILFDGDRNAAKAPIDDNQRNQFVLKIIDKWTATGKAGDAIHEILQIYFSDKEGKHVRNMNDADLFNHIKSELSKGDNLQYLDYNGDVDANINKVIEVAKQIHKQIRDNWGDDCLFLPEYLISGTGYNNNGKEYDMFGKIDLLVVDSKGKYHIIDYKTSTKNFSQYDVTKKEGYSYLLATYYQMLENSGLNITSPDLVIIPLQIEGFEPKLNGYLFNNVIYSGFLPITNDSITLTAFYEIEKLLPSKYANNFTTSDIIKNTEEVSKEWFKGINLDKSVTEESIKDLLEKDKVFDKKDDNGLYSYTIRNAVGQTMKIITDSKEEMIKKVMAERLALVPTRLKLTGRCIDALEQGIKQGSGTNIKFPKAFVNRVGSSTYLHDTLSPYCSKEWEVKRVSELEDSGIILLHNKNTHLIDIVRVSTSSLYQNAFKKTLNRKSILANFETDALAELKRLRLIFEGTYGNIELLQTVLMLNSTKGLENYIIGNIQVINPYDALMSTASNEEILVNFNALSKHFPPAEDNFNNGNIKLARFYDLLENELTNIWTIGDSNQWKSYDLKKYKDALESCKSEIDAKRDGSIDDRIKAIQELIIKMLLDFKNSGIDLQLDFIEQSKLKLREIRLYNLALFTLAELKGIHFRLQNFDHHKWFSSIYKTLTEGQSGNYIDNPGNLDSETLNLITSLVKEANLNIREDILKEKPKLDKLIHDLKENLGFGYLKENIGFNQADLYKPLYDESYKNDLVFKRIEDVPPVYRPLLDYLLTEINKRRYSSKTPELLLQMRAIGDYDYYKVPLARGGFDSQASAQGLFKALVSKLKYLNPKNWPKIYDEMQEKIQGLGRREEAAQRKADANMIYSLENFFDRGETNREQVIDLVGINNLERNAETLALKYIFAYSQERHINDVFPMIQAASAHLSIQGANANTVFKADKSYLNDYVRSKIKKESIVDPAFEGVHKYLLVIKAAASKMTLAFTPVQMLYLPLQGLWLDISLMIRKPDGKQSFTFEHFKTAIKLLFEDFMNFTGEPTLLSKINEFYALNDMDINKYIDNIAKNKKGLLYNFDAMAYKFASRPDYYNRMAIFLALMLGDGCLEAHSIVNGELKYDWTKDKRFSKFAANPKDKNNTDPEYIKQRALYYAVARQMVNEGVKDENGDLFELNMEDPKPLPKAYPAKQAEGYKSLADDIYGYYTEENKSLIQAGVLGSMWLLFKTYWSGKKNLYLLSGAIRMRGNWEEFSETVTDSEGNLNTIKYYYDIKENGDVDYNTVKREDELPENKRLAPVIYWKGLWQEGVLVTMSKLLNKGQIIRNYNRMMQEDPDMARCYKSNIQQLSYDMLIFVIGGIIIGGLLADWLKELLKENKKNTDVLTGMGLAAANVAVWTVKNSFLDFNIFDSLGSPITSWTPFSLDFTARTISNLGDFITGDLDFMDTVVKMNGWTRLTKPFWDAIKPEMFRTKLEGGTFGGGSTNGGGASGNY